MLVNNNWNESTFSSYINSLIQLTFISNKVVHLHIIQEVSKSILKRFLRNGLPEQVQLIGQHLHPT